MKKCMWETRWSTSLKHKAQDDREAHLTSELMRAVLSPSTTSWCIREEKIQPLGISLERHRRLHLTHPQTRIQTVCRPGVVLHTCNPSIGAGEAGGLPLTEDRHRLQLLNPGSPFREVLKLYWLSKEDFFFFLKRSWGLVNALSYRLKVEGVEREAPRKKETQRAVGFSEKSSSK